MTVRLNAEELERYANEIQDFLSNQPSEEPTLIMEYGNMISSYIALTTKMLADAKYILNDKREAALTNIIENILTNIKLSAGVQNSMIASICKDEQYMVDWVERLNKSCTHTLEWCRSILSYTKEEMRMSNGISSQ